MARTIFTCRIGGTQVALAAEAVGEVLPVLPLWRPPTLPAPVAGFVQIRGQALPVLATAVLLGLADTIDAVDGFAHIVRPPDAGPDRPCLLVDRVEARHEVAEDAIRPIADRETLNGTVIAEIELGDGVAHLLSLDRLLDRGERARLAALTEAAAERAAQWAAATT